METPGEGRRPERQPTPWAYVGVGFELVGPILLGVFVGYGLDTRWGTTPWLLVVGALLGMAAGFTVFLRSVLPPRNGR